MWIWVLFPILSFALTNAKSTKPNYDLIRIEFDERNSVCTGFFISPTTLITAGHCLKTPWKQIQFFSNNGKLPVKVLSQKLHPDFDIGYMKTTAHEKFEGVFKLSYENQGFFHEVEFEGAGKVSVSQKKYGFTRGRNWALNLGDYFYTLGKSGTYGDECKLVSVSPNDSGGPILETQNFKVIGVAIKSSVSLTAETTLPALSVGLSLENKSIQDFIQSALQ